jgi:predicted PurR-regulated permease PerM
MSVVAALAALVASLAFAALVAVAVPTLLQLRRTAQVAEQTLAAVEREVRPLATQLQGLLEEHREVARRASRNLREVEGLAETAHELLGRLVRLTGILSGVGTVGRILSLAQGVRKGVDVFIHRLARRRG